METATMGKVLVSAKIENLRDLWDVARGTLQPEKVHRIEVADALVDTGSTSLILPKRLLAQLDLMPMRTKRVKTIDGNVDLTAYGTVRLSVQGRECTCDVIEAPDTVPAIIGQVPLELMDWVVDPKGQQLIGNPAHGGEWAMEAY
jgi:clan AA aspartic protease